MRNFFHFTRRRKLKKDYEQKEFANPYFNDQKNSARPRKRGFNTKFYLKILAVIFIVYLIIYSDLLKIEKIEITGPEMINEEEFRGVVNNELNHWRWYLLPQANLLLLGKNHLAQTIEHKYDLKKITINKGWKSLKINIEEKISYLIVFNAKSFYFADINGQITKELAKEEAEKYWTRFPILNVGERDLNIGERVINNKAVDFILRLNEAVKTARLDVSGYEDRGGGEVWLVAKAGWRAYFDINNDLKNSFENLLLVLKEKINPPTGGQKIEYIDLRFGDKVYYK